MTHDSNPNTNHEAPAAHDHESAPEQKPISGRIAIIGATALLIIAVVLAVIGILGRKSADAALAKRTIEMAAPAVIVAPPKQGAPSDDLVLPGNVTAYTDSPIYARTNGYLTRWYYDIGARVKKGALLAEISSPEVDQQLIQAQADLNTVQAQAMQAKIQADRYTGLVKTNAVSQQDTDMYVNQAAATAAAVHSAQANVQRLKELQSFEKVYAPFDGVVTARNVDTGQLISAGVGKELFHLQAVETLRVYINLPQVYTSVAKNGDKINITFPEHPGKVFQGILVRNSDAIDPTSRTLLVEVDVANHDGELLPGSLAQVHFHAASIGQTYVLPAAALIFRREGMKIGIVDGNSVAHLVSVTIGQDDGATIQILTGLNAQDRVIQDPPDSLMDGQQVTIISPAHTSNAGGK